MAQHAQTSSRVRARSLLLWGLVAVLVASWSAFALLRSTPSPRLIPVRESTLGIEGRPFRVSTAKGVQEVIAVGGVGTVATSVAQTPTPIASLTKVMSALVVLRDHPLAVGQSGPGILVTPSDVAQYRLERSLGDSVVKVRAGETLSELQALEAMLVPSGDNVTQLVSAWDARSPSAFLAQMNALAKSIGMRETTYAGTSGVNPATVSTANDQLRLAEVAMGNPVFAGIVAMPQVILPVAGLVYNVNADLGTDGIDGVKTGWLPQSGGCVIFSAEERDGSKNVSILGVVLGEGGRTPIPTALGTSRRLVKEMNKRLRVNRVKAGTTVADYVAGNGQVIPVVTTSSLSLIDFGGSRLRVAFRLTRRIGNQLAADTSIGTVVMSIGPDRAASTIRTTTSLSGTSLVWRFTHI